MCNVNVVNKISCFCLIIFFSEGIGVVLASLATPWLCPCIFVPFLFVHLFAIVTFNLGIVYKRMHICKHFYHLVGALFWFLQPHHHYKIPNESQSDGHGSSLRFSTSRYPIDPCQIRWLRVTFEGGKRRAQFSGGTPFVHTSVYRLTYNDQIRHGNTSEGGRVYASATPPIPKSQNSSTPKFLGPSHSLRPHRLILSD